MTITENKLRITEAEKKLLKKANVNSSPSVAAMFLKNEYNKLHEGVADDKDIQFYIECIKLFRTNNFEVSEEETKN